MLMVIFGDVWIDGRTDVFLRSGCIYRGDFQRREESQRLDLATTEKRKGKMKGVLEEEKWERGRFLERMGQ